MVQRMTQFHWCGSLAVLVAVLALGISGCDSKKDPAATGNDTETVGDEDGHDHDGHDHDGHDHDGHDHDGHDDHAHADHHLGPNGGHFANLEPGDIKVEWVILDEGKELQVFVPEAAEQVTAVGMHVQVGDDQLDPYSFTAAEDLGKGAWRLSDPALFSHVKMTADHEAGVTVEIVAETDAEPATAKITHHQH